MLQTFKDTRALGVRRKRTCLSVHERFLVCRIPVVFGLITFSLLGCSGEANQSDAVIAARAEASSRDWKSLPDGSWSYFARRKDGSETTERCWHIDQNWDCLGAYTVGRSGSSNSIMDAAVDTEARGRMFFAARVYKKRLDSPFPHSDEDMPSGGYRCYTTGGGFISETIFAGSKNGGVTLLSNDSALRQPYGGSPWPAKFVNKFMRDNGITADRPYWNCAHIERLIALGSLATLATTALTYHEVVGPAANEGE